VTQRLLPLEQALGWKATWSGASRSPGVRRRSSSGGPGARHEHVPPRHTQEDPLQEIPGQPRPSQTYPSEEIPRRRGTSAAPCRGGRVGGDLRGLVRGRTRGRHRKLVVSAGSPIPVHLSSAPTIQIQAAVAPRANAVRAGSAVTGHAAASTPLAEGRGTVPTPLAASQPATAVSSQPPVEAPATSPQQQAPPSAAPPASSGGSSGGRGAGTTATPEAGKSFDTSG
jgi:hypothetical protein